MKAILVIDMPNDCSECPCFYDYLRCQAKAGVNVLADERPNNCPLKPIPQKIDEISIEDTMIMRYRGETIILEKVIEKARQQGYNKCIDELLGE